MSRDRRLRRLEAANAPPAPRPPHVLEIAFDETDAEARARFVQQWGPIPKGHKFIVVPKAIETDEEEAIFERRFMAQQQGLVATMRSLRPEPKEAMI